jgi:uroporphyrinogen-III synthase
MSTITSSSSQESLLRLSSRSKPAGAAMTASAEEAWCAGAVTASSLWTRR